MFCCCVLNHSDGFVCHSSGSVCHSSGSVYHSSGLCVVVIQMYDRVIHYVVCHERVWDGGQMGEVVLLNVSCVWYVFGCVCTG